MIDNPPQAAHELLDAVGRCPVDLVRVASWCARHCGQDPDRIHGAALLVAGMVTGAARYVQAHTDDVVPVPEESIPGKVRVEVARITAAALNDDRGAAQAVLRELADTADGDPGHLADVLLGLIVGPLHSFLHDSHDIHTRRP